QLAPRGPVGAVAEQVIGLHHFVNLAGALVDDRPLAVAIKAPRGIFVGIAVGAVHLHAVAGGALGRDRGEPLPEPRLARLAAAGILEEPGAHPQQARRLVIALHLRDHFLHQLVLADLDAEGLALERVLNAGVAARADEARGPGRDRVAPLVEREHRDL